MVRDLTGNKFVSWKCEKNHSWLNSGEIKNNVNPFYSLISPVFSHMLPVYWYSLALARFFNFSLKRKALHLIGLSQIAVPSGFSEKTSLLMAFESRDLDNLASVDVPSRSGRNRRSMTEKDWYSMDILVSLVTIVQCLQAKIWRSYTAEMNRN